MDRARPPWAAYLQLACSMMLVGASVVLGKRIVDHVPVPLTAALRFFISVLVLFPLTRWSGRIAPHLDGAGWLTLALQAFCGVFLFNLLMLEGVQRTSML